MTRYSKLIFSCLLSAVILNGCSGDEDKKPGALQEMTDKVAGEAVENIRQPIERAQQVQAIQGAHTRAVNEAVEESNR
jgi:PBP1b-binding outer membrane lipoprotein LpoB